MHLLIQDVLEFHQKMSQTIGDPRKPDLSVATQLRYELIREEFEELTLALEGKTKTGQKISDEDQVIAVADALGDMAYVIAGAAIAWGIDLGNVHDAIHASNMTKSPDSKRADGKVLKGPGYVPPDIRGALALTAEEVQIDGFEDRWPIPKHSEEDHTNGCTDRCSSPETVTYDDPPISVQPLNGQFLPRGAFVFDCPCGRSHEVSLYEGTRGPRVTEASCDCLCGKHFDLKFGSEDTVEIKIS